VEATRQRLGTTDLVWTGPSTKTVGARPTRAVVLEMIGKSHTSLTLSTYAGHDIADLVKAIDEARLSRGVHVRVIVETPEDSVTGEGPSPATALKHLPLAVPVYRWPKNQRGAKGGAMHVKCLIRDAEEVLITSANLTSAALDRNMELGLAVQGGDAARRLEQHYGDLIETGVLVKIS
ncbi:MAG: DISARM system phospholipase D-like protein DrmC, partial [Actinomycetota bacterium]